MPTLSIGPIFRLRPTAFKFRLFLDFAPFFRPLLPPLGQFSLLFRTLLDVGR